MAEGDYVIAHGRFSGIGRPAAWIAADIVRIEDGKLAEHWDVLQDEATGPNPRVACRCSATQFPEYLPSSDTRHPRSGAQSLFTEDMTRPCTQAGRDTSACRLVRRSPSPSLWINPEVSNCQDRGRVKRLTWRCPFLANKPARRIVDRQPLSNSRGLDDPQSVTSASSVASALSAALVDRNAIGFAAAPVL